MAFANQFLRPQSRQEDWPAELLAIEASYHNTERGVGLHGNAYFWFGENFRQ